MAICACPTHPDSASTSSRKRSHATRAAATSRSRETRAPALTVPAPSASRCTSRLASPVGKPSREGGKDPSEPPHEAKERPDLRRGLKLNREASRLGDVSG